MAIKNNRQEGTIRVALYTRISTDEDHQKYSLDAQRDRLDAYCKSQYEDYKVFKIYRDTATGTNMNRPGLEQMIADAEKKKFDALIVFRVDRLSRNVRQLAQMVELLTDCNVVLRSSTEPFDTSNAAGKMMMQMLGVFAEFEHATIVERTKVGMERKARNGEWCGGFVPYGYQKVDGEIVINEDEAAVVRRMFRDYVYGRKGATKIFLELNEAGMRKRSGILWDNRAVIVILKNPFYTGMIRWKESIFEGKHEGIISTDLFEKAQAIFEKRSIESNGERFQNGSDFFLTGLVYCGRCGKGLVGRAAHRNGHRHRYYACANRSYHRGCDLPFIRADLVEPLAVKEIESIFSRPELLQRVQDMVAAQFQAERPEIRRELQKVEEDLTQTRNALDRYFAAFESGALKPEVLAAKIDEVNLRLQQLEEEKDQIEGEMAQLTMGEIDAESFAAYLEALKVTLEGTDNEAKKHMLRLLVEKVIVHDRGHIEFWFKLPDGTTVRNALENGKTGEANSCSINELTAPVCNQDNAAPRTVVIANRRGGAVIMMTELIYDGKPSRRKFFREGLKIGIRKPDGYEPQIMGDIEDGVSHFLCPNHKAWLPNERYDQTLTEKRDRRRLTVERWIQGLSDGRFRTRADIARSVGCSRAWVTRLVRESK